MAWESKRLLSLKDEGELIYSDGYRTKRSELADDGFRIIRAGDIKDGRLIFNSSDFVDFSQAKAIGIKTVREDDVAITTKGTIGRIVRVNEPQEAPAVWSPQVCFFRFPNPAVLDRNFFSYWLGSTEAIAQIRAVSESTDMAPYLNLGDLGSLQISLPDIEKQRAIGNVLGSLDDKIAANHRVIRTSIELAESLVSRSLTMGSTRLSDVAKVTMGTSPKGEFLSEEVTGLPFYQGVRDFGEITPQQRIYTDNPVREAEAGDILFAVRAPVGEVNIASERTAIGRGLAAIRGVKDHNALFYLLRSRPEIWNTHQDSGTVFSSINTTDLANAPIPEVEMNSTDATLLDELHREALSLTSQNNTLAKTRDELLPLLMSGKITVREAGQEAEAAGAQIPSEENEV